MAFSRKFMGKGLLGTSTASMYTPSGGLKGVIGKLSLFNESTTTQVKVTIESPHTGTPDRVLDEVTINPRKSYKCSAAVNEVIENGYQISGYADTTSVIAYTISGAEE